MLNMKFEEFTKLDLTDEIMQDINNFKDMLMILKKESSIELLGQKLEILHDIIKSEEEKPVYNNPVKDTNRQLHLDELKQELAKEIMDNKQAIKEYFEKTKLTTISVEELY